MRPTRPHTLALLVAATLAAAAPAFAGIHYESTTTTESDRGKGEPFSMVVAGWVDGGKAKVEFRESANPLMPQGSYLLTQDGGKTLLLVNPEEKTYAEWDVEGMLNALGGAMRAMGPMVNIEISDPHVEKLEEGPGGTLVGLPTTRYKYRTTYDTKVKVLMMSHASSVDSVQEIWSTRDLADLGLGVWLHNRPPGTGDSEFDKLTKAEMEKVQGFPLKMVTVSTDTDRKGRQSVSRTTMEVTALDRHAAIPAATFVLPEGYTKTEIVLPTAGDTAQGEEGRSRNPFKKVFGGG